MKIKAITQPLGLMYLSAYIKSKSKNYEIRIFDSRFYYDDTSELELVIKDFCPDIVGLSALTQEADGMHYIAHLVKGFNNKTITVAGGPHPTQFYDDVLSDKNIDFVIRGEGEEVFYELLERIRKNENIEGIEGISYRSGNRIIDGGRALLKIDINDLPYPDYESIEMERYFNCFSMATIGKRRYAAVSTSRGCPFECIYCHNIFGRRFRYMRPERIVSEIEYLVRKFQITDIEFVEDIFNLNRERTEKILDMLIQKDFRLNLAFPNGLRTDMLDKEMLIKFRKAGTIFISFAIETASSEQQRKIKKKLNLDTAREMIDFAADLGILCNGFFMLGFPGESREEIKSTIDFALNSRLHTAYFFIVNPFKGTLLYEMNKDVIENLTVSKKYDEYSYFLGRFNLSKVSTSELLGMQRDAYIKFYLNPLRIFRIINGYLHLPSGVQYLTYYGLKTIQLIIDRAIKGILHYEDSSNKTKDASR
ncbi:MAG: B12-binding domain-containing radical SAM protein [Myxococcota bacterium]